MPVSFNSPPRNFFLLGSGAQQALTNFFDTINRATGTDRFTASDIAYSETDKKYILAGSGKDSNSVSFGWLEKQAYDADTDPANPTNVEDWRRLFNSPGTSTSTTLNFMKQTTSYGGDIIIGGKTGSVPWISKYDSNGAQQWVSSSQSGDVEYFGVACTSTDYYACGHKTGIGIDAVGFVEKWDIDGVPLWGKSATHVNGEVKFNEIAANARGEVVVVGSVTDQAFVQGYVAKLDTNTGDVLWDKTINSGRIPFGFGSKNDVIVNNVYIDGKDQVYVVGMEFADTFPVYKKGFIIKYSPEGNLIWHKTTPSDENHEYLDLWSDTPVEQTVVLSRETTPANGNDNLSLIKYSKNGDIVFKRRIVADTNFVQQTAGLDGDPSFYYMLFVEDQDDLSAGTSKAYTFGQVSASGNGFGDFVYDTNFSGREINYTVNTSGNPIGRLADGSVRNDSSDFISYPYSGLNLLLGDDLATNVSYKKTRHKNKDLFEYSGSPAIRPVDFSKLHIGSEIKTTTTTSGSPAQGQQAFTTPGSSNFIAPANVTSVCVVCVGGGAGSGGALAYKNNISVVPGTSYPIIVGAGGVSGGAGSTTSTDGGNSSFADGTNGGFATTRAGGGKGQAAAGGVPSLDYDGGGEGGDNLTWTGFGGMYNGAGAGGYSGKGGNAGLGAGNSTAGQGGGGGGGGWAYRAGGGVGLLGEGASGAAGGSGSDGQGGSGGQAGLGEGSSGANSQTGGNYGGGFSSRWSGNKGGDGAVRVIWGPGRAFPSTNTADVTPSSGPTTTTTTTVVDQSGNGFDGTIEGATQDSKGHWQFDGTNDLINLNSTLSSIASETLPASWEAWVYFNAGTGKNQTIIGNAFSTGGVLLRTTGTSHAPADRIRWVYFQNGGNGTGVDSADALTTGWHHIVGTYNGNGLITSNFGLYIDGSPASTTDPTFGTPSSIPQTLDFGIGGIPDEAGPYYWNGKIGEVRIYSRVLTDAEVFQNYNSNKAEYLGLATETRADITNIIVDSSLKLNCDFGDPICYSKDHNLFPYGKTPGDSWSGAKSGSIWTENTTEVTAPDSTFTATKWEFTTTDPYLYHQGTLTANKTYTMSIWVKAGTGMAGEVLQFRIGSAPYSTNANSTIPADGSWKRITFTKTIGASDETNVNIGFEPQSQGGVPSIGDVIYVWGAQLEEASSVGRLMLTEGSAVAYPTYTVPKSISGYTGVPVNQAHDFALSTYQNLTYDDGCFVFNGVDSSLYWSSNHIDTFPGLVAGFTLEAWINTNSFTTTAPPPGNQHSRIIGLGGTGLSGDMVVMPNGKLRGRGGGAAALEEALDPDAMNLNQWYHVVTTLSEERFVKIYRDGVLKDTYDHGVGNAAFNANPKAISIGRYVAGGNSMQYDGKIGQARAYARSLSAAEILNNFEVTRSRYGV